MNGLTLTNGTLTLEGATVLSNVPATVLSREDPTGVGVYLQFSAEKALARLLFPVGDLADIQKFTCCHRYEPFWMTAKAGTQGGQIPIETQYVLAERVDGSCLLIVPIIDGAFRCSLQGTGEHGIEVVAESGDPTIVTQQVIGLFVAVGEDPFTLLEAGAESIAAFLKTGRLRRNKSLPAFCDFFGWCTWDAFYQEVTHDKVRLGLESFREGGIEPRYLILDDGWQSVKPFATGDKRLTTFGADESKFPGDLAPTVQMAKSEFPIHTFLVWHAVIGYWGGIDSEALPGYGTRVLPRRYSAAINHYAPELVNWFGTACGTIPPDGIYRFYQDYHRHLRKQGVDGVKVDNQASLEGISESMGGRVAMMQAYHEALEGSVHTHFQGNLINCMSCANEMIFGALNSNLTRTSTDFWPNKPESHGLHLYVNAQVSAFFGEFVHPDWDMFQSGHEMGMYHAAGRAVGGCPVYVSDKPDGHNFDVLQKLVLPDGSILRCDNPGRPTRDCLFADPTHEDVLLKIWNVAGISGILGAFHARHGEGIGAISGVIRPSDIPDFQDDRYAVFAHHRNELRILERDEPWEITLEPLTAEVFSMIPINQADEFIPAVALVGVTDYFNCHEVMSSFYEGEQLYTAILRSAGKFVAWCEQSPIEVIVNGEPAAFTYDPASGRLDVAVSEENSGDYGAEVTLQF